MPGEQAVAALVGGVHLCPWSRSTTTATPTTISTAASHATVTVLRICVQKSDVHQQAEVFPSGDVLLQLPATDKNKNKQQQQTDGYAGVRTGQEMMTMTLTMTVIVMMCMHTSVVIKINSLRLPRLPRLISHPITSHANRALPVVAGGQTGLQYGVHSILV